MLLVSQVSLILLSYLSFINVLRSAKLCEVVSEVLKDLKEFLAKVTFSEQT